MFDTAHIHPMIVHFPIALGLMGWLLASITFWGKKHLICGEILLYFATAGAIAADFAGNFFTPHFAEPLLAAAKNTHSNFAAITLFLFCSASVFYIAKHLFAKKASLLHKIGYTCYTLGAIFVSITGFYGGVLVYNDLLKL